MKNIKYYNKKIITVIFIIILTIVFIYFLTIISADNKCKWVRVFNSECQK